MTMTHETYLTAAKQYEALISDSRIRVLYDNADGPWSEDFACSANALGMIVASPDAEIEELKSTIEYVIDTKFGEAAVIRISDDAQTSAVLINAIL